MHYKNTRAAAAAEYCDTLDAGGYSDWFLPSKDELAEVYNELFTKGYQYNFPIVADSTFWSSSEESNVAAWYHDFYYNNQGGASKATINGRVRAVRAFP